MGKRIVSVVLAAVVLFGVSVRGDDKPSESSPLPAPQRYKAAKEQWAELEKKVSQIAEKFQAADDEQRTALRTEYEAAVKQAPTILDQMRAAATELYEEAPNKDPDVLKTLIRMVADDVRRDEYDRGLKLGKLLIDNKAPNPEVYNYAGIAAYSADDFDNAVRWLQKAADADSLDDLGANCFDDAAKAQERFAKEQKLRAAEAKADDLPRVRLETSAGPIVVELFENEAPETVGNFISLVEKGFYNGLTFHRVLPGFMAQGGDPEGTGGGGPGYTIYCECDKPEHRDHFRGTLSMAKTQLKNTGGSQFFITFRPTRHLDGKHTAFGRLIEGLDVLAKIKRRDPQSLNPPEPDKIVKAEVIRKRDHAYEPHKVE
jgi:cyclophilin family peptidyl-prolyl cis-trans isomerase